MISAAQSNGVDRLRRAMSLKLRPSQFLWESDEACKSTMLSQPAAPTRLWAQPSSPQGGQLVLQGVLLDPTPGAGVPIGLTRGVKIGLGS